MFRILEKCEKYCLPILGIFLVGLQSVAAEPKLEAKTVAKQTRAVVGQPCTVDYSVEWQGARDAAVVLPVEIPQPDWGTAEVAATRTEHEGDRWRVTQAIEYHASRSGKYTTPSVEVEVITSNQPIIGSFGKTPGTRLKMEEVTVTITAPVSKTGWGAIFCFVFVLAALAGILVLRNRRKRLAPGTETDVVAASRDLLHLARRCRLDGNLYGCYQSLLKSAETLQTADIEAKPVAEALRARIPAVGFQGVRPTDDEMDGFFRDIERIIARRDTPPL